VDLFSQVKFCPKGDVGIWVYVSLVVVELSNEFKVVSHESEFFQLERALKVSLEYCNEQG